MLFMIRTPMQHFLVLALFTLAAVAAMFAGNEQAMLIFTGFVGGAMSIGREQPVPQPLIESKKDSEP